MIRIWINRPTSDHYGRNVEIGPGTPLANPYRQNSTQAYGLDLAGLRSRYRDYINQRCRGWVYVWFPCLNPVIRELDKIIKIAQTYGAVNLLTGPITRSWRAHAEVVAEIAAQALADEGYEVEIENFRYNNADHWRQSRINSGGDDAGS